jgi:hypothetical protein
MNDILFWAWGPSLLIIAAAVALIAARHDRHTSNRHPAE